MTSILDKIIQYDSNRKIHWMQAVNQVDILVNYTDKSRTNLRQRIYNTMLGFLYAAKIAFWYVIEPLSNRLFARFRKAALVKQIKIDNYLFHRMDRCKEVASKIREFIIRENLFSPQEADSAQDIAQAVYATTYFRYVPVLVEWIKNLLIRAKRENLHLVFLARDGIPPFEVARIVQERNPEFSSIGISCVYLSRTVVSDSQENLQHYLEQQSFVREAKDEGKNLLFLDLGFVGSMIPKIQKALNAVGISNDPNQEINRISFEFLISASDRVHGYVGNLSSLLSSVRSAGKNRGIYWVEDTHQGVLESPSKLVKDETTGLYEPDTVRLKKTCKDRNKLDFLCKTVAQWAIRDFASQVNFVQEEGEVSSMLNEKMREDFDKVLQEQKMKRFMYLDHV